MGIEGLLKFLDPVTLKEHISSFQGKTAAIDIMSWLYKGCYRCAFEHNQNIESNNFLYYIFEMIDLLSYYSIRPLCVFDGKYVGKKEGALEKRKRNKEENRQKGMDYLAIGNEEEARKYLSRCIIIDERIIATTMKALHTKNIDFMVAPYESDSQIAKLISLGLADFAITEDSDLVVYGVRVMLKLSQDGDCDYIDLSKWTPEDVDSHFLKKFLQLDYVGRLEAAILSGTDYNNSVKGIGIKRAIKHIHQLKNMFYVISHLRETNTYSDKVPPNYQKEILESKLIFLFATTYNPFTNSLDYLNDSKLSEFLTDMTEEQIQEIVGKRYEYTEDVRTGRVNVKNFEKREIHAIDFKTVFSLNANTLQSKQLANHQRRVEEASARQRKEQQRLAMAENGNTEMPASQPRKKKQQAPVILLTEQERKKQAEQRKAERIKRFNDFKQLLNNFIVESDSQSIDEQQQSSEVLKEDMEKEQKQEKETIKDTAKKEASDEQAEAETFSDSEQDGECLQFLNPWLKN